MDRTVAHVEQSRDLVGGCPEKGIRPPFPVRSDSAGCYLLELAGLWVPLTWVEQPRVARVVDFVPAALLTALVVAG
ncbi:hypothetical protein [Blastococcus xanthinilyticus]|uniref:Uncharacterized protein n=1 Tax=Blastococcus xanthinilyticus TaxID=1564164 RepID=A0A5S5CV16_9ACTN|nr:hypothetical protein [Blastococcus xanthinilyticus]TYP86828.1 hypothetical protein BD833_108113 [Blastococcus xanthinilyticus]